MTFTSVSYTHLDVYKRQEGEKGKPIDMVIVRENTEDLYIKIEKTYIDKATGTRVADATKRISEIATRRIATIALDIALKRLQTRGQATLTVTHKSNVLSQSDGLFREICKEVYESNKDKYGQIKYNEQIVDSMVYRLFREPQCFDAVSYTHLDVYKRQGHNLSLIKFLEFLVSLHGFVISARIFLS